MQPIETGSQENFPQVMFQTHVFRDRVVFTLPMRATMETLVPLARQLIKAPEACSLEAKVELDDNGELVITLKTTSD